MKPIDQYENEKQTDEIPTRPVLYLADLTGEDVQLALDIRDRRIKELELIIADLKDKYRELGRLFHDSQKE